ncbi:hypothetical protein [Sphingomonas sp. PB1R3]|uniref:hypothetical protein n=1 Tax=Sphingomonas flavida TaxID=3096154 RepID=UPI002FC9B9F7
MVDSPADVRHSRKPLAAIAGLAVVMSASVLLIRHHESEGGTSSNDGIVVISARSQDVPHRELPETDPAMPSQAMMPSPAMLDATDVDRMVSQYLPVLREVRSECDADRCSVSAEPSAAGAPLDEQAFSQLVQEDMPASLARAGYGLTEPIQIEELGPDQYRLLFRIERKAQ